MQHKGEARQHFWLTLGMARHQRVDLGAALAEGVITPEDYAAAIESCRDCAAPGACRSWLDRAAPGTPPPPYCRNAALFAELAAS